MARGDQLSRQWKIIQALTASRTGMPAAALADRLECHSRTVYRDLEALQQAGFPLCTENRDGRTYWSMLDSGSRRMPIPMSLTELMALYFSRNLLKVLEGTAIHDSLDSLFEKVKATLPPDYIHYLEKIEHSLEVGVKARKPYHRYQQTLETVQAAVQERTCIDMDYFAMSRNRTTRRRVEPYTVWFYDETFYLIGYCRQRRDIRIFAVDRIEHVEATDQRFDIPDGFDAETFMGRSFGVFQGDPVKVTIRFDPAVAGYVREKIWHPSQTLTEEPDGSLLFDVEVAGTQEIKRWALKWGAAARVIAPRQLREEMAAETGAMAGLYG